MKLILFFDLLLLCVSCNYSTQQRLGNITLHLETPSSDEVVCSDLFEVQEWIKLDTSRNYIVGQFAKAEYYNNNYYLLDNTDKKSILVFDTNGKGIGQIGKLGGGPGEYSDINDFTIDKTSGEITVITKPTEFFKYSHSGSFFDSIRIDNRFLWKLTSTTNGILASSMHLTFVDGDNAFLLYDFDRDFNLRKKDVPVLPVQMTPIRFVNNPFQTVGSITYYCDEYCNVIYTYDVGELKPTYNIGFQKPCDPVHRSDFLKANQYLGQSDFIMNYAVTKDKMLIIYVHQGPLCVAFIDLSDGSVISNKVLNDIHFPNIFCSIDDDGTFVSPISIESYMEYWKNSGVKQPDFMVSDDDNYLLMKWKLK